MNRDVIEDLAKVINGPYDDTHIGPEKLKELQQVRWTRQTTKQDRAECLQQARAVMAYLEVPADLAIREPNVAKLVRAAQDLADSIPRSRIEKTSPVFQVRVSDLSAAITALVAATHEEEIDNDTPSAPGSQSF